MSQPLSDRTSELNETLPPLRFCREDKLESEPSRGVSPTAESEVSLDSIFNFSEAPSPISDTLNSTLPPPSRRSSSVSLDATRPLNPSRASSLNSPFLDVTKPVTFSKDRPVSPFVKPTRSNSLNLFIPVVTRGSTDRKSLFDESKDLFLHSSQSEGEDVEVIEPSPVQTPAKPTKRRSKPEENNKITGTDDCDIIFESKSDVKKKRNSAPSPQIQSRMDRYMIPKEQIPVKKNPQKRLDSWLRPMSRSLSSVFNAESVEISTSKSKEKKNTVVNMNSNNDMFDELEVTLSSDEELEKEDDVVDIDDDQDDVVTIDDQKKSAPLHKESFVDEREEKMREKKILKEEKQLDSFDIMMKERKKKMKALMNKTFIEQHHDGNLEDLKEERRAKLKEGDVIRKAEDRALMHGTSCPCCSDYYDALGLSPSSKAKRINQVSRHRYVEKPMPKTPEHYWDVGFPSESELKRRGLIRVATPPTGKDTAVRKLF